MGCNVRHSAQNSPFSRVLNVVVVGQRCCTTNHPYSFVAKPQRNNTRCVGCFLRFEKRRHSRSPPSLPLSLPHPPTLSLSLSLFPLFCSCFLGFRVSKVGLIRTTHCLSTSGRLFLNPCFLLQMYHSVRHAQMTKRRILRMQAVCSTERPRRVCVECDHGPSRLRSSCLLSPGVQPVASRPALLGK